MMATLIVALIWLVICPSAGAADPTLPNIVFIMADDMGIGDLGCYNPESKISTPNMDAIAREGIRCLDVHTPSSVCTPTRYGVLTGRYAWRTRMKQGVLGGYSRMLIEPGRLTVASLLKEHGYATAGIGKWHLGLQSHDSTKSDKDQKVDYAMPLRPGPVTVGFDYFFGIPASLDMAPYLFVENDRPLHPANQTIPRSEHRRQGGGGYWRAGAIARGFKHVDVLPFCTQRAVSFIENHVKNRSDQPFFLYFPLSAPHTPWLPTESFRDQSKAGYYGDFVAQVDASVGQIASALARTNVADRTLLIVTSDNGSHWPAADIEKWSHAANLNYRGQKADIWEGGHRVPWVARWPGEIRPRSTSHQTICLTDLLATTAAIVGVSLPSDAGEDSYNILPVLRGDAPSKPVREATVHHSINATFAIRQGPWKLIIDNLGSGGFSKPKQVKPGPEEAQGQLYHLEDDPSESTNLYGKHPDIVARLRQLLKQYREQGHSRPLLQRG